LDQVQTLFSARRKASLWENFTRRWQGIASVGGEAVRSTLGLDQRPIVLLATNVIGDSLTLGRQVFSDSMTEWLSRTVQFFAAHPEAQLVVRIHPGELITKGPSVAEVVRRALPEGIPEHIYLVPADAEINTYDLIDVADLGLVYTTTVGLEMAMSGIPVIAIGQTHYRGKGFTLDPDSWEAYFHLLNQTIQQPKNFIRNELQVNTAWEYAYRFFFEYPQAFPWHLLHLWDDIEEWSIERVLSPHGMEQFGAAFSYLSGEPRNWAI
jgi:capsule polysaccharide export protein KpsC/LpsZ